MTKNRPKNVAASVRQRLLNVAQRNAEDFQLLLTRFAAERLLYRLSTSRYQSTTIPGELPICLSDDFASDLQKRTQWNAFIRRASSRPAMRDSAISCNEYANSFIPCYRRLLMARLSTARGEPAARG